MKRITTDERMLFSQPQILSLYETLKERLQSRYPDMTVKAAKTQVSFRNRFVFAMASPPWRRIKGWPEGYLLVSFGLPYQKIAPRIVQSVEAYPNRWTHHVPVAEAADIDAELLGWIGEAYAFAMVK